MDFYRGTGTAREGVALGNRFLTDEVFQQQTAPGQYRLIDPESGDTANRDGLRVVRAVNTALALRMPLLVSGEPGSGKTQLGYAIAHELGRPLPLKFVTKSVSAARDLFYTYDAVQHFQASQINAETASDPRDYIAYAPLGLAILLALTGEQRAPFLPPALTDTTNPMTDSRRDLLERLADPAPQQSVVIIDEIDKAPRDFPNDLLHELENMSFHVPELRGLSTPAIDPLFRPIVVITTNSERQLPEAFLRRCAYVHLTYPKGHVLEGILSARLSGLYAAGAPFLRDVANFYVKLREGRKLRKAPGTAELLQFLQAAKEMGIDPDCGIAEQADKVAEGISLLGKLDSDQSVILDAIRNWPAPG